MFPASLNRCLLGVEVVAIIHEVEINTPKSKCFDLRQLHSKNQFRPYFDPISTRSAIVLTSCIVAMHKFRYGSLDFLEPPFLWFRLSGNVNFLLDVIKKCNSDKILFTLITWINFLFFIFCTTNYLMKIFNTRLIN